MAFNLAQVHEAVAAANPDRPAIIWGDRRWTYQELTDRTRRFANALLERGIGVHRERDELAGHESGQDHVALYLHNGNEYIEAMLGAYKARVAPFNVNYRYVAEELRYLLNDAGASASSYHWAPGRRSAPVPSSTCRSTVSAGRSGSTSARRSAKAEWNTMAVAPASLSR